MTKTILCALLCTVSTAVMAQAPIQVIVPAGMQRNPAGGFVDDTNGRLWFGDSTNGIVSYKPNGDGTYSIDLTQGFSIPGAGGVLEARQVFQVSPQLALVAISDPSKGSDNKPFAGVYSLSFDPTFVDPVSPVGNLIKLAPNKGLSGATSAALGSDLKVYVGFRNSPNLTRINGDQTESVGGLPNGQPIFSLGANGADVYAGGDNGLYKFVNAPTCQGNQNNCGAPVLIAGGTTVAVTNDNAGHIYFSQQLGGLVRRLNLIDGTTSQITSGLSFTANTAGLVLDGQGNLLIGQGTGEIDRVSAADLAATQ